MATHNSWDILLPQGTSSAWYPDVCRQCIGQGTQCKSLCQGYKGCSRREGLRDCSGLEWPHPAALASLAGVGAAFKRKGAQFSSGQLWEESGLLISPAPVQGSRPLHSFRWLTSTHGARMTLDQASSKEERLVACLGLADCVLSLRSPAPCSFICSCGAPEG